MSVLIANDTHGEYEWKTSRIRRLLQSSSNYNGNEKFKTLNSKFFFKRKTFFLKPQEDFFYIFSTKGEQARKGFRPLSCDVGNWTFSKNLEFLGIFEEFLGHSLVILWEFFLHSLGILLESLFFGSS